MPTSKKKSPASSSKGKKKEFRSSYVRLRTVLDAMELAALRYYMNGKTDEERYEAAAKIEPMLMDMIQSLKIQGGAESCPRGYNNCGGCCVPYPCPSDL